MGVGVGEGGGGRPPPLWKMPQRAVIHQAASGRVLGLVPLQPSFIWTLRRFRAGRSQFTSVVSYFYFGIRRDESGESERGRSSRRLHSLTPVLPSEPEARFFNE